MSTTSDNDKCQRCGFPKATHHKLVVNEESGKLWFTCMKTEVNDQVTMYVIKLSSQRRADKTEIEMLKTQAENAERAHKDELTRATAEASAKVAAAQQRAEANNVKAIRLEAELNSAREDLATSQQASINLQLQIKELEADKQALEDELDKRSKPIVAVPPPPAIQPAAAAAPAPKPAARPTAQVAPIAAPAAAAAPAPKPAAAQPAAPVAVPAVTDVVPPGGFDLDDEDQAGDQDDDRDNDEDGDQDEDGDADDSDGQPPEECRMEDCNLPATQEMTFIKRDGSQERIATCGNKDHLHNVLGHVKQHCKTPPKSIKALAAMFTPINQ